MVRLVIGAPNRAGGSAQPPGAPPSRSRPKDAKEPTKPGKAERTAVQELVTAARAIRDDLTGPEGLLKVITAAAAQAALEEEMTVHLGHEKHHPSAAGGGGTSVTEPGP